MNALFIVVLAIGAVVLVFNLLAGLPPRGVIDKLRLGRKFHGFVLFGKDGAHVTLHQLSSGDRVTFRKRVKDDEDWYLKVVVHGPGVSSNLVSDIRRDVVALGDRFNIESDAYQGANEAKIFITGTGLKDHHALEGIARLLVRRLGHSRDAKYKVEYLGPTDYDAVDQYFEKERKKWRGQK